jgi:hypothetical protein
MTHAIKTLAPVLGVILAGLALLFAFRWLGIFFVIASLVVIACRPDLRTREMAALVLIGFLSCSLLPIDISFNTRPGLPKLIRVYYGKPNRVLRDRAAKGEVVLGGCMVSGYDPLWVIVW